MQRIFKLGDIQTNVSACDKKLNSLYVIIYRNYKLVNMVQFFWSPVQTVLC